MVPVGMLIYHAKKLPSPIDEEHIYEATGWDGKNVFLLVAARDLFEGVELLQGHSLPIDVQWGAAATIVALPENNPTIPGWNLYQSSRFCLWRHLTFRRHDTQKLFSSRGPCAILNA